MPRVRPFQEEEAARGLLAELLEESRLYRQSREFGELLDFVARLRSVAPFNAMLLHIQNPGVQYVATGRDWRQRFCRKIKDGARPLLILYPFGPVMFVYDVADTEGEPLPGSVLNPFPAEGDATGEEIERHVERLARRNIEVAKVSFGAGMAGRIEAIRTSLPTREDETAGKTAIRYKLTINNNHDANQQFATLSHELAHLFLGHLGSDDRLKVKGRPWSSREQAELEAESTAYLVCMRRDVRPHSQPYLAAFLGASSDGLCPDLYAVTKAAGMVESLLVLDPLGKIP
jgi:hypothetical protein